MSSIPLPALGIKPPENPLETFSKLAAIRAMGQEQQLRAKQIQGADIANQQNQAALDSEKGMLRAYKEANGDLTKAAELAPNYGVLPGDVIKLKSAGIKQQSDALDLVAKQGTEAARQADLMLGAHDAVDKAKPEDRPVIYQQQRASLQQQGVDISSLPPQYPGDDDFKTLGIMARAHSKNVDDALKASEQFKNTEQGNEAAANRKKIESETNPDNPADPNFQKQKYQGILEKLQQPGGLKNISAADYQWARAYEASQRKSTTSSDSLGINTMSTSGPAGLASVGTGGGGKSTSGNGAPALTSTGASMVDEIGTGKMAIDRLSYLMARKPQILQAVAAKYPDFDSSKVKSYIEAYKDFTTGTTSKQINAGAVALQHLKQLKDINDANPGTVHIAGTEAYNKFHNLLDTVTDELVTFYGEPKTNQVIESKKSTLGALVNRDAAITEQAKAMGVRMDEIEQRWKNAAPSSAYQAPMPGMSKQAQSARAALDPEYASQFGNATKAGGGSGSPTPQTHAFSVSAWKAKNPQGDEKAAAAAAQQAGYKVIP